MQDFWSVLQTLMICGTLLGLAFFALLSMPHSKLREFLLPIVGWAAAIFCAVYAISPIDVMPEMFLGPLGLIDDVGAVVAGVTAASIAMNSGE